jgi:type VI secretion system secreted protein Hcp
MAETVHLKLKANGNDIKGESSQHDLERQDTIEIVEFWDKVYSAREKGSRSAVGRRVHDPIAFSKRVDSSSPLLAKALCNNEKIEGVFKFYRPNPAGDGTTEQFFTIKITNGRIDSIERHSPSAMDPASSETPLMEIVKVVFEEIEWTYEPKGIAHVDKWSTSG